MEDKILEVIEICNRLPDYVFSRKYHHIYFFEMPMPQIVLQRLINILTSGSISNNYYGILSEPFNSKSRITLRLTNEIPDVLTEGDVEEKEITWAYNIGYIKGKNWELYYEFDSEMLVVGNNNDKDVFEEAIKGDRILMKYYYPLDDLINYFKSIATSNYHHPIDKVYEEFLNNIKFNYGQYASPIE